MYPHLQSRQQERVVEVIRNFLATESEAARLATAS
jgi:hypothetical protein